MWALKAGTFKTILLKLRQVVLAFVLLDSHEYVDMLVLQLALWEYQLEMNHPVIDILRSSPQSFVGEDIELFNRLLSQHSKDNSRRSEAGLLNNAYQSLGVMVQNGMTLTEDLLESKQFLKGNRRYVVDENGLEVEKVRKFLKNLWENFANSTYSHYAIPRIGLGKKGKQVQDALPMDTTDPKTMRLSTAVTGVASIERKKRELISVSLLAAANWHSYFDSRWNSLLTRDWKFKSLLKEETLERFQRDFKSYAGEDRPRRREKRKNKRKLDRELERKSKRREREG